MERFKGGTDGAQPVAGLVLDSHGNFYGSTTGGGNPKCGSTNGCGVVCKLGPNSMGSWTETVLHSFGGYPGDGAYPYAALTLDGTGSLYGVASQGGSSANCVNGSKSPIGCGVVYKLRPPASKGGTWQEGILYSFTDSNGDGANPWAGLIFDQAGNLYGSTLGGGGTSCSNGNFGGGCGVLFELSPSTGGNWTERILHNFVGSDGANPQASLILDLAGNLYGTTYSGALQIGVRCLSWSRQAAVPGMRTSYSTSTTVAEGEILTLA